MNILKFFRKKESSKIKLKNPIYRMKIEQDYSIPKVNIRYLYNFCNDLEQIRYFYTGIIGLKELFYQNEENEAYLIYKCEGFAIVWLKKEIKSIPDLKWSFQPGYNCGDKEQISWSIEVCLERFQEIIKIANNSNIKCLRERSEFRQDAYWGFTLMDPMGNTVEIFCEKK